MSKKHHNKSSNNTKGGKTTTNGVKHSSSSSKSSQSTSSSSSSSWNIYHLLFALMSLFLGIIITPSSSSSSNNNGGIGSGGGDNKQRRGLFVSDNDDDVPDNNSPFFVCDSDTLSNYLHDVPIPGLHIVCIDNNSNDDNNNNSDDENTKKFMTFYKNSQHGNSNQVEIDNPEFVNDWGTLKSILIENLQLTPSNEVHQPWATFGPYGDKLLMETNPIESSIDKFGDLGMFLVFQGGQWIWPGVRKGYERTIQIDNKNTTATLETLSLFPLVLSVKGFLSTKECDYIQNRAEPEMKYSVVTLMDHDKDRKDSDFRTSQTTFLSSTESPILKLIDDRTAALVRMPRQHQEHVQVLRYGHSQNYVTHHDYFHPKLYSKDPNTLALIQNGKRNRMATVFWYLSDVHEGGHTVFPRFDKGPSPPTSSSWELGLKVKPEKGKVIVFYSMTPDGELDEYSLHGAAPVGEGNVKWAANKWVWNMPMHFTQ